MLFWTALSMTLSLRLALARSGIERGAQGPGCHHLHCQHWPRQPVGAVGSCLSSCREAPTLCGCG
ncbi:von Willebrand factor A domain-containing protein 1 isoform X2 [Mus pahari]|uniref:von Willebrand factor A domain-containing protein 1 isoform X2 n=1 Tax=Mus pahari TaxID=10093 RepID=UPI000A30FBF6|nr:von Willebrand factor A domain-containing protein 1 isoform X2 [Mus pahari]